MSRPKSAVVRFYFDADVLGLARAVAPLRSDITFPGDPGGVVQKRVRPACPISSPEIDDEVWIPTCAREGWLAITRDNRIQTRRHELKAVRMSGARLVAFEGVDAVRPWNQLEVLMCQWRAIERLLVDRAGPFVYRATRTSISEIDISLSRHG